jgi:signal transduction histidine kinase
MRWVRRITTPVAVDAALVVVCLSLTALAAKTPWSPLPVAVILIAGVLGSLAQGWRRRRPALASLAGSVAYALSGNPGPLLIGLYSGAAYAPRRRVWALGLFGAAGIAAYLWIDAGRLTTSDAAWAALGALALVALGAYVATRRALYASLKERAEGAETQRRMLEQQARSDERARIAAEMHDVLAHKVSLIALHAGALEVTAADAEPRLRDGAALIRGTAREALQELRQVLGMLRTDLDPGASQADLAALVAASVQAGQPVELRDDAGPLPAPLARVVYRIAQEGLTNAHKHAPHAPTTVSVERDDSRSVIVSVHNGRGVRPSDLPGSGSGLVGLAERVRLMGGTIHGGPEASGGWLLRADLPWSE